MMSQKSDQTLATACRAASITKSDFMSMFLLSYKMRSGGERIVNQADLSRVLKYFDHISIEEAKQALAPYRH